MVPAPPCYAVVLSHPQQVPVESVLHGDPADLGVVATGIAFHPLDDTATRIAALI